MSDDAIIREALEEDFPEIWRIFSPALPDCGRTLDSR